MKVSLSIIKQFIDIDLPPVGELVERINQQLGGVEEVIDLGSKYKDAVIVRVVSCDKHPDADKLSVCLIDDGGLIRDIERNSDGYVQVVCGAPNAHSGMLAVWLPPASTVPSTYDTDEPFVLGSRELRGVMSNGMLASAAEMGIGDDHSGIIDITESDLGPELGKTTDQLVGMKFSEVFGLDDYIIDIENKMFTHRPDLFGQLGVAREINAIFQDAASSEEVVDNRFVNPSWYWLQPEFSDAEGLDLEVFNEAPEASPRFMAVAIKDVEVEDSPLWLKCQLVSMGSKPINNIVDWTNYMMLITAQPTHAYDYDKLRERKIGVRMAKEGEQAELLNGKTYELSSEDIVIADGAGVIGLAGVMGGFDSEVTKQTKNIVLEIANFNMYKVRKTSMRHGLFTDAVTRFNKGQSPLQVDRVAARLLDLLPGVQASPVYDFHDKPTDLDEVSVHGEVEYRVDFVNKRLGTNFTAVQIGNILRPSNIATYPSEVDPEALVSTAPFWRTDVELPEDVVEEVGRLYGFDKLPRQLPVRSAKPAPRNYRRQIKQAVRESLSRAGANEVLLYSFVHENIIKRAQQDTGQAFRLSNALSPDLQYYRLSVLPSLLDKVRANIKSGYGEFTLFEIGKSHYKNHSEEGKLPSEYTTVDAVYASKESKQGAAYYHVRRLIDQLASDLNLEVIYEPISRVDDERITGPFELSRAATVRTSQGIELGYVGELKQQVKRDFKLPEYIAAMTIDLDKLQQAVEGIKHISFYEPLSRYPSISHDISLKVPNNVSYQELAGEISSTLRSVRGDLHVKLSPVSIYKPEDDASTKTVTMRLKFTSYEKTLTDKDVSVVVSKVAESANRSHSAVLA